MEIVLMPQAIEDLQFWKASGNKQVQKKISILLNAIAISPYTGIGQPEPLKHELAGYCSRRITIELT